MSEPPAIESSGTDEPLVQVRDLEKHYADGRLFDRAPVKAPILGKTEEGYLAGEIDLTEFIDVARENWRAERKELDILERLGVRNAALRRATGRALVTNETTGVSFDDSY